MYVHEIGCNSRENIRGGSQILKKLYVGRDKYEFHPGEEYELTGMWTGGIVCGTLFI